MENDLISRSALLEKSEYFSCYNSDCDEIECEFPYISRDDVENAPAVDAVEVVRCKDCKHFLSDIGVTYCDYHTAHACDDDGYCDGVCGVYEDDFCSYGERRNDV